MGARSVDDINADLCVARGIAWAAKTAVDAFDDLCDEKTGALPIDVESAMREARALHRKANRRCAELDEERTMVRRLGGE